MDEARAELRRRHISCYSGPLPYRFLLRKLGVRIPAAVGYRIKSWDVLATVNYLEAHVPATAPILDLGANTSEILPILHRLGYTSLTGIDFDAAVRRMPYADAIDYVEGDFLHTPFEAASFDAITSISAIEHGYDGDAHFRECARLLRPDGHLIVSFDYWPEKIDTTGTLLYGMSWRIFSREETLEMIETARRYGFELTGDIELDARDRVVQWGPWKYTFAWMVLRRRP